MSTDREPRCDNRRIACPYYFLAVALANSLQEIIDETASLLGRSVALDDAELNLLAHSAHFGDEDAGRVQSLLHRTITGPLREHVVASGIHSWTAPGYLPTEESVAMAGRLCVPLRSAGRLQGFIWLIDDGSLSAAQLELVAGASRRIAPLLGEAAGPGLARQAEAGELLLRALTRSDPAALEAGPLQRRLATSTRWRVLAVRGTGSAEPGWPPLDLCRAALRSAVSAHSGVQLHEAPVLAEHGGALAVLAHPSWIPERGHRDGLPAALHAEFTRLGFSRGGIVLGIGNPCPPSQIADSYDQAEAALAARRPGDLVADWEEAGSRGMLALLPRYAGDVARIPFHLLPGPVQGLAGLGNPELAALVKLYLDMAGSVSRTAAAAHLHRTTVYAKLEQFESLVGAKLDSGDVRLMLHWWLQQAGAAHKLR